MVRTQFSDQILVIEVDGTMRTETLVNKDVRDTLRQMQKIVGGYIELVRLHDEIDMYVDEDGLSKGLEPNPRATSIISALHSQVRVAGSLVGPVVLAGNNGGSRVIGLPQSFLDEMTKE